MNFFVIETLNNIKSSLQKENWGVLLFWLESSQWVGFDGGDFVIFRYIKVWVILNFEKWLKNLYWKLDLKLRPKKVYYFFFSKWIEYYHLWSMGRGATLGTHCKHWLLLSDCQMLPIKFTQQLHLMLLELVIVQELVILCTKCYM